MLERLQHHGARWPHGTKRKLSIMEYCGLALARVNWPYDPFAPCPVHELHGIRLDIARHPTHGIAEKSRCRMPDALTISLLALAWLTPLAMVRAAPESRGGVFPAPHVGRKSGLLAGARHAAPAPAVAQDHLLPRSTSPREHRVRSLRLAALKQGGRLGSTWIGENRSPAHSPSLRLRAVLAGAGVLQVAGFPGARAGRRIMAASGLRIT